MSTVAALSSADQRHFLLRKLHSLTGIFPVGVFLVEHLFSNSYILQGATAYGRYIEFLWSVPYLVPWMELALIAIPLGFHAFYGIAIARSARANVWQYNYLRNWLYTLQRVTGFLALAFIAWHVFDLRFHRFSGEHYQPGDFYAVLRDNLSWPPMLVFYVLGLASTVFHFANGISTFLISWGVTVSNRSQKAAGWFCTAVGLALFVMGLRPILHLLQNPA